MPTIQIEESLHDALKETDLLSFQHKLAVEKQLTKIEHFDHVTDEELKSYGFSAPAVRRLRNALDRRKKAKKSKLFSKTKASRLITMSDSSGSPKSTPRSNDQDASQVSPSPIIPCLIARDDVKVMEKLGEGGFATVKKGVWQRAGSLIKIDCAVKILNQMSEQAIEDLHAEIAHMQKLKHQNIIQFYGIVFGEPTMLIIEFCDGGSLLDRLRNTKKPVLLVTKLLSYALQIASGMAHLENRHVIHRDLALRNVLLADNEEVVKICDFGMTRSLEDNERLYVMSGQKKVPFGWCPPESLRYRQFSHKSDCWAFGVTLFELYSYGEEPWIGHKAADVLRVTEQGEQLKKPRKCLAEIYDVMKMCWNLEPELRPKFSHLRNLLLDIKFMTAETRESFISNDPDTLELSVGDHVIIISENGPKEWYGQCVSSRKFGRFPHSLVSVKSHRIPDTSTNMGVSSPTALAAMSSSINAYQNNRNTYISKPVPGSLIHTGHGDIDKNKCWGNVDRIDEIYLKNPVTRAPGGSEPRSHGVSFISSITALHDDFLGASNPNAKVRPISASPIKQDVDPLKAWDLSTPSSSSTKIPSVPTKPSTFNKPDAFDPVKNEIDKWKVDGNKFTPPVPTEMPTPQPKYTSTSAAGLRPNPTPSDDFNDAWNTENNTANYRRNQTQPIVLPSVVSQPSVAAFEATSMPEDDPFVVDPNLKNLTMKPQSFQSREIAWRSQPLCTLDQTLRPQSARPSNNSNFTQRLAPLDQNVLALLDPLLSNNAKSVSSTQPTTSVKTATPAKTTAQQATSSPKQIALPPETVAKLNQTASVTRPQSNNHYKTAPSALNVLAFVDPQKSNHQQKNEPKLTQQSATTQASTPAWTYLPPSTAASSSKRAQSNTIASTAAMLTTDKVSQESSPGSSKLIQTLPKQQPTTVILPPKTYPYVPASSLLPPPSELAISTSTSNSQGGGSLLPPPSQLLLSGLKAEPTTSEVKSKSTDSAYGSLTSNSSTSRLTTIGANLITEPFGGPVSRIGSSQPTQQVFNIQNSSAYNPPPSSNKYFGQHFEQPSNMLLTQNNQPLFYSQSGIPFLFPTPLDSVPKPSTSTKTTQPTVSLHDLDIDKMVSDVKSKVDFATVDQCSKALKASGYEITEAINYLKVEKLIEMGLCADRSSAVRALVANDWDVNNAAIQLVS